VPCPFSFPFPPVLSLYRLPSAVRHVCMHARFTSWLAAVMQSSCPSVDAASSQAVLRQKGTPDFDLPLLADTVVFFLGRLLKKCCCQVRFSSSKYTKMHLRWGLRPGPLAKLTWLVPSYEVWGSLQRSPRLPSWFSEGRFAAREGKGRKGRGKGRGSVPPLFTI